jgi:GTP-binding protein
VTAPTPEEIERGRRLFAAECTFVAGAAALEQIPEATLSEIAFAGRSNVGKSSLVNALTGRKTLARVSHTPGRTQQINFFTLGQRLMLADLPGYGFAKVSKSKVESWTQMTRDYLRGRTSLRRVCVLIDSRHGLKPVDLEAMAVLDESAVSYQVVLTKSDEPKAAELAAVRAATERDIARRPAAHPEVLATSAREGSGIPELRAALAAFAE